MPEQTQPVWQSPAVMLSLLRGWQQQGLLNALDLAFSEFLYHNTPQRLSATTPDNIALADSITLLLAALLSHQVSRGHVCLPLAPLLAAPKQLLQFDEAMIPEQTAAPLVSPLSLLAELTFNQIETALGQHPAVQCDLTPRAEVRPLVLCNGSLYLYRYWHYEQQIAADLQRLMQPRCLSELPPFAQLSCWLTELFPPQPQEASLPNWQKLACANTLRSHFSVITGGPGTGKTYTVVRLLALLQRLQLEATAAGAAPAPLVIKLAAPTGKAAARLKESIQAATASLQALPEAWQNAISQISADSSTLHKLLGVQPGTRQFRQQRSKPLALDVLIIDEASMVDIELMQATLAALPPKARLVLLGDKDQLASVEAGAVLGQLCAGAEYGGYRPESIAFLQQFSQAPLPAHLQQETGPAHLQHVVMLRVSRRFTDSSGIGALAKVVNTAQVAQLATLFQPNSGYADLRLLQGGSVADEQQALLSALAALCQQGFAAYWQVIQARPAPEAGANEYDSWARKVLATYQQFQLVTPVRAGPFGVSGLNQLVQQSLAFLPSASSKDSWFIGRPVMVTANDYNLNLRNGDIGMVLPALDGQKRVVFIDSDNRVRWIIPSRLTEVVTVFAMTVHKSQGSEFAHTVLVLPERDNPVLSRELVYTGLTRAASQLTLVVPSWPVLEQAILRRTLRAGHLRLADE